MKIPPRVREQAAVFCSAMASWANGSRFIVHPVFCYHDNGDEGRYRTVHDVARLAQEEAHRASWSRYKDTWAEAEALLRTGWEP